MKLQQPILEQHSTPGMIMGTVGYMSPEQAQGKVREMTIVRTYFPSVAFSLKRRPDERRLKAKTRLIRCTRLFILRRQQIKDVNPDAPPDLQRIVRRCLAKEPDKRYQSIKDVAIELDELRQELKDKAQLEYSVQPESDKDEPVTNPQQTRIDSTQPSAANITQKESVHSTSSAEYLVSGIRTIKKAS
jgi:serine/threonine protein kinase